MTPMQATDQHHWQWIHCLHWRHKILVVYSVCFKRPCKARRDNCNSERRPRSSTRQLTSCFDPEARHAHDVRICCGKSRCNLLAVSPFLFAPATKRCMRMLIARLDYSWTVKRNINARFDCTRQEINLGSTGPAFVCP